MGRSKVLTRRPDRFEHLSTEQERAFRGQGAELVLTGKLRSYNGNPENAPYFKEALKGFESDVSGFRASVALTDAFVLMCNEPGRKSKRTFETLRSQLSAGILRFAAERGLSDKPLKNWPTDLVKQVIQWLRTEARKENGELLADGTARRYYGTFVNLFAQLQETPKLETLLPELEAAPNNVFSGRHGAADATKSIGQSALVGALLAARADFLEVVQKVRYAQKLLSGAEVAPDSSRRGEGQFRNLDAVLWYLSANYPGKLPPYTSFRDSEAKQERALFEAIRRLHGGWSNVAEYLQPLPESCVAPMLLVTIFGHFNTGPLRTLRTKDLRRTKVLNQDRLEVRLTVQPGKERGTPYRRSFPIDDSDPCSPNSVLEVMLQWTERIRRDSGKYHECIFIHVTQENEVKAFASAKLDGYDSDMKWLHHLKHFCKRHNLPNFNVRELRLTSLDYGMWTLSDDLRATFALKGGASQQVVRESYTTDGARMRASSRIAELQAGKERYIRTKGKAHHMGSQSKDLSAATPGWKCVDSFDSPIPGEVAGRQCGAFGRCPSCPHGSPQITAVGLARLLQLREELEQARPRMPLQRWVACWQDVHDAVERKWIPLFNDKPQLWERVRRMSLAPIGVVE